MSRKSLAFPPPLAIQSLMMSPRNFLNRRHSQYLGRFLFALWGVFAVLYVAGSKTPYFVPVLIALCFLAGKSARDELWSICERRLRRWHVYAFMGGAALCVWLATYFQYESFDAMLWDTATYIQAVFTLATTGKSYITFMDKISGAELWHFSISIPILGFLYRLFGQVSVLFSWQVFFFMLPGAIVILWNRALWSSHGRKAPPLADLLCFSLFVFNPNFSGQMLWPYLFHIAGPAFFALAYLFYFRRNWLAWLACLALFTLQKEEFGLFSASFGAFVLLEGLLERHALRRDVKANLNNDEKSNLTRLLTSMASIAGGIGFYAWFTSSGKASVEGFRVKFWNIGQTPADAVHNLFTHPSVFWAALARPASLKYLLFFALCSLIWLVRDRRAWKYIVPISPFILIYCLAGIENLHLLKDHYSDPMLVGLTATLILGVQGVALQENWPDRKIFSVLALALALISYWGYGNPFRVAQTNFQLWFDRAPERRLLGPLKNQKDLIVCCQERLCAGFSERKWILDAQTCAAGSELLTALQAESLTNPQPNPRANLEAVYLVYPNWQPPAGTPRSGLLRVPVPDHWQISTGTLKLSERLAPVM